MSVIQPDERIILITGINSETFLTGYNPEDRSFDKSQTPMKKPGLYTMVLSEARAKTVFYERKPIRLVTDWEALEDSVEYNDELALYDTTRFAYLYAKKHEGDMLILMMRHSELKIDGIDYNVEERGCDYVIKPGKVRLERIMKANNVRLDKRGKEIESMTLEDVTATIGVGSN